MEYKSRYSVIYFCLSSTISICLSSDLTFTPDQDLVTIDVGSSWDTVCSSQPQKSVEWWRNGEKVAEYATRNSVEQLTSDGMSRIFFYDYATEQDSGKYYCNSTYENKVLKITFQASSTVASQTSSSYNGTSTEVMEAVTSGDSEETTEDFSDAPQEVLTVAIVVPVLVVLLIIAALLLLYFRNRTRENESAMKKPVGKKDANNYEIVDDFLTTEGNSSAVKNNRPVSYIEVVDVAEAKSGDYQSLNWNQMNEPAVNDLYDRLGQPAKTVSEMSSKDDAEKENDSSSGYNDGGHSHGDPIHTPARANSTEGMADLYTMVDKNKQ